MAADVTENGRSDGTASFYVNGPLGVDIELQAQTGRSADTCTHFSFTGRSHRLRSTVSTNCNIHILRFCYRNLRSQETVNFEETVRISTGKQCRKIDHCINVTTYISLVVFPVCIIQTQMLSNTVYLSTYPPSRSNQLTN